MMVMENIDIDGTSDFLIRSVRNKKFSKVYYSSNEDLYTIFSYFNFKNKDVLSVLASSDQIFSFYNAGASTVDTFDINKLAFYYYYIRRWIVQYFNDYYINGSLKCETISNLLGMVDPLDDYELLAYNYWNDFIKKFDDSLLNRMFYVGRKPLDDDVCDINTIKKRLESDNMSFYNVDISGNVDEITKKYDIIFTSNVIDYVHDDKLEQYKRNLCNLLNDNGVVLGTNVCSILDEKIKSLFSDIFDYYDIPAQSIHYESPGFYFVKK